MTCERCPLPLGSASSPLPAFDTLALTTRFIALKFTASFTLTVSCGVHGEASQGPERGREVSSRLVHQLYSGTVRSTGRPVAVIGYGEHEVGRTLYSAGWYTAVLRPLWASIQQPKQSCCTSIHRPLLQVHMVYKAKLKYNWYLSTWKRSATRPSSPSSCLVRPSLARMSRMYVLRARTQQHV